mmetsp:Transcript_9303/g.13993  ORF Transcript_9303/g.13993 Transcript_9303/m.13993 type:complete len:408 (-) Transcript_9303:114-1337(-)|eukprot:CAMPEP_0171462276 /NCGR_PEP_ID=MMETSP0945-20130129/6376_1 /TAXON_ID=109269 /ORGANISM="Vaucheria litorea, Strain CCMP2940" /LENGTH=407 /DNA_ID=CAMNT_0011988765 /DNA_START=122 /DNA_END=1345 /DNA_ORIENTATION=-
MNTSNYNRFVSGDNDNDVHNFTRYLFEDYKQGSFGLRGNAQFHSVNAHANVDHNATQYEPNFSYEFNPFHAQSMNAYSTQKISSSSFNITQPYYNNLNAVSNATNSIGISCGENPLAVDRPEVSMAFHPGYSSGPKKNSFLKEVTTPLQKSLKEKKAMEQAERRKERNRELAKKTRLRKKFFFEALQENVKSLSETNSKLKSILKEKLGNEKAAEIFKRYDSQSPSLLASQGQKGQTTINRKDFNLMSLLNKSQQSFVLTDPNLPDNPIIFASEGFMELTGYQKDQIIGRNCRFLQGPKTDPNHVNQIKDSIKDGADFGICILNYKKDGTPFHNQLFIAALKDENNRIVNFVGVQAEVPRGVHTLDDEQGESNDIVPSKECKVEERIGKCNDEASDKREEKQKVFLI